MLTHDFVYYSFKSFARPEYITSKIVLVTSITLGLAIAALIYQLLKPRERNRMLDYECYAFMIILSLSAFCLFLPEILLEHHYFYTDKKVFLTYPVIFNIILFLEILGAITIGYFSRGIYLVNLGIVFFAIHVLTLYFSTFWRLLPRSLFFMLGGLLLLLGGVFLERKRRDLIAKIKAKELV